MVAEFVLKRCVRIIFTVTTLNGRERSQCEFVCVQMLELMVLNDECKCCKCEVDWEEERAFA